ncbi:MAG: short-chain dehydrogenase [Alphaproteobacteria bacterium]|nr:MAG: short-chain dehydrogenase [Alphaproteobacteria bacterium]
MTDTTGPARHASVVVVGAGDYIGGAIARRFAAEGYLVFMGRRNLDKLLPTKAEIETAGGRAEARALDAREEDQVVAFVNEAEAAAPVEVVIFNIGANVNFPLLETTSRVFRKVWELACFAGFLTAREGARVMLPRGKGSIFFTGATAGLRGGSGYAAFASAKFGIRAVAQATARELGPKGIHVAHLVIDAGVETEWVRDRMRAAGVADDRVLLQPASVAETYWALHQQSSDAWTFETEIRPAGEIW